MHKRQWEVLIEAFTIAFDKGIFEVDWLEEVFWWLGVGDELPQSNELLDFSKIDITSIRVINWLIDYF